LPAAPAAAEVLASEDDLFLFLKSVSYQPVPFSLKLLADTSFFNDAFPQAGQSVKGASLNFWIFSSSAPQDSHRYSYIGIYFTKNDGLSGFKKPRIVTHLYFIWHKIMG